MTTRNILIMPGDGIGPEVMTEVERLIAWFNAHGQTRFDTARELVGGTSYDVHGTPVTEAAMEKALAADAVLFGAVGGPKWASVPYDKRPEAALLRLRKDLGLFANLRPAICFDALKASSTLKPEIVAGLDIMIVRELTGGVYFGEPRGITNLPNGERRAVDTQVYTTQEIHRIARVAFELARLRGNRVASAEKHNVMTSGLLWKDEVTRLHAAEY
ncbi:MAG: isocitrate/isopropylmalate family dehydrogenase, partial [Alphaproteobacteria bacterium]